MSTIEQIKSAIAKLSLEERAELAHWFHGWIDDEWDAQIAADAASGKFAKVIEQVDADIGLGRLEEMP